MTSKKTENAKMKIADNLMLFPVIDSSKYMLKKQPAIKIYSHRKKPKKKLLLEVNRVQSEHHSAKMLKQMEFDQRRPMYVRTPKSQSKLNAKMFESNFRKIKSLGSSPINRLFSIENSFTSNKNLIFKRSQFSKLSRRNWHLMREISKLRKKIVKKPKIQFRFKTPEDKNTENFVFQTPEKQLKCEKTRWEVIEELHRKRKKDKNRMNSIKKKRDLQTKRKSNVFQFSLDFLSSDALQTLKKHKPVFTSSNLNQQKHSVILNQNVVSYQNNSTLLTMNDLNDPFNFDAPENCAFMQSNGPNRNPPTSKKTTNGSQSTFVRVLPKKL